jgi:photosystem II stability/assembly factor-like uncharacterized protein
LGYIPESRPQAAILAARVLREKTFRTVSDLPIWELAGPTNIPGRITDIAVDPTNPNIIYAGSASGGVFKSIDFGYTWSAIFDEMGIFSIGALAIHPTNSNVLYVGTGESNARAESYEGNGVYKTTDGGSTWSYAGLPNSYQIGRIVIDPLRPETVFVAVLGKLFGTNPERGVYRSTDGGTTWERKFFVSDSTCCVDIALHPSTGTLIAAMWERIRDSRRLKIGGPTSRLYRSVDFGETWSPLSAGLPSPFPATGRIGVTVSPTSNTVYAFYSDYLGGFAGIYKSSDLGSTWVLKNDSDFPPYFLFGDRGWFFGQIRMDPADSEQVFVLGVPMYRSTDGGSTWGDASSGIHVDHHALVIHPSAIYNGCDGGVNISTDGGNTWRVCLNMSSTQFYTCAIDLRNPRRLYGGTQDNGTLRTLTGNIDDWQEFLNGDGFYCVVDHANSSIIYAERQFGDLNKSINGGASFFAAMNGINYSGDRHNWNTPVVMDPSNHNVLYYGSHRIYKTTNGAVSWTTVSGDLTDGNDPGNLSFGTITTIDVALSNTQTIYAGTDDANVWVSKNGGGSWTRIDSGLPNRWVTRVAVDPRVDSVAYATFSGYRESDPLPHIFRTTDYGQTWIPINGNLPDSPINDVVPDPEDSSTLYVATDVGVFFTTNLGTDWVPLGAGMPIVPVLDLSFHLPTRTLVAATHGRSMFKINLCGSARGDMNADGQVSTSDVVLMINCAFLVEGSCYRCFADINCDGRLSPADIVSELIWVYLSQPPSSCS